MKRRLIFGLIIITISANLFSQGEPSNNSLSFTNQVQFEAFGPGSLFSINYETGFPILKKILSERTRFRIGVGGTPLRVLGPSCNSGGLMTFPIGINYVFGKNIHHLETGGGVVLPLIAGTTKVYCPDLDHGFFSEETTTYTYLLIGYRLQPTNKKKPVFRAFVSPLFPFKFWAGASLGIQL